MSEWKVGQEVFAVYSLNRRAPDARCGVITKIGRRWAYYGEGVRADRFDAETGLIDGGGYSSPGRVYRSEAEYRAYVDAQDAWSKLVRRLPHRPPPGVTVDIIREVESLIYGGQQ